MINHEKTKTYREGYKLGYSKGYARCKKVMYKYFKRKYHMIDIDKMTSDMAKEYGQEG
jgi:hypothetical protein